MQVLTHPKRTARQYQFSFYYQCIRKPDKRFFFVFSYIASLSVKEMHSLSFLLLCFSAPLSDDSSFQILPETSHRFCHINLCNYISQYSPKLHKCFQLHLARLAMCTSTVGRLATDYTEYAKTERTRVMAKALPTSLGYNDWEKGSGCKILPFKTLFRL